MIEATLGIDIGSSSIKGVLLDVAAKSVLAIERQEGPFRIETKDDRHYEEDPIRIRDSAFEVIRALAHIAANRNVTITAIAFTGQMHGVLIVDSQREPLTNFISWQDKRGDELLEATSYVERLRSLRTASDETGVGIHTGFAFASLYWFSKHAVLPTGKAVGIYDWLSSLLVGRVVTDITSAAAWAMYDIVRRSWKYNEIAAAGLSTDLLPDVAEPGASLGGVSPQMASALSLPADVVVHNSIGDTQASYIGSGCAEDEVLLNFGTGSQSMWQTSEPRATHATDIRYFLNGRYLVTAPTLAGGKAYSILAEFFSQTAREFTGVEVQKEWVYSRMNELALQLSPGVHFDPIFAGSRFRPEADRASITGLTAQNFGPAALTRGLLEGMVEEIALPYFEREKTVRHKGLVGSGNGMRKNPALREVAAARFGLPLRICNFEEEAALGAAMLPILQRVGLNVDPM